MLLASLLQVAGFSANADFPTDPGSLAAVDIHDVPIVPAAAAISSVNGVSAVVDLPACF